MKKQTAAESAQVVVSFHITSTRPALQTAVKASEKASQNVAENCRKIIENGIANGLTLEEIAKQELAFWQSKGQWPRKATDKADKTPAHYSLSGVKKLAKDGKITEVPLPCRVYASFEQQLIKAEKAANPKTDENPGEGETGEGETGEEQAIAAQEKGSDEQVIANAIALLVSLGYTVIDPHGQTVNLSQAA